MKQYITPKQLNELSQKARVKLRDYMMGSWKAEFELKGEKYTSEIPTEDYLLSIGQMIEFLGEKYGDDWPDKTTAFGVTGSGVIFCSYNETLCDKLWEACKEILDET